MNMTDWLRWAPSALAVACVLLGAPHTARGQDTQAGADHEHMANMPTGMSLFPSREGSGTAWLPQTTPMHAFVREVGDWQVMLHGNAFVEYFEDGGERGHDQFGSINWIMAMARHEAGAGRMGFRTMFSAEPWTVHGCGYPDLFASGERCAGTVNHDIQHPHDLFMELSASYAHQLDADNSLFLYAGDPGEPALGPTAYMHRPSSMDIPDAPITHHWLDSTHIAFGVLTAGFVHDDWKVEVSQFTGREPDQNRFDFDPIRLDSTAARVSWNPDPHWSLQVSWGHLNSPEQLTPEINENRTTASATYVTAFENGSSLAATLAWGLKQESDGADLNGVLLESEYRLDPWTLFARTEWEQNNELDALERTRSVGELTLGAIHDWPVAEHLKAGLGALYTFDFVPPAIAPVYGRDPHGFMAFVRLATR